MQKISCAGLMMSGLKAANDVYRAITRHCAATCVLMMRLGVSPSQLIAKIMRDRDLILIEASANLTPTRQELVITLLWV